MMIETSSYNDVVIGTLVADIRAFKNRFFVKMLFLLTKMLANVVKILSTCCRVLLRLRVHILDQCAYT